MENKTCESLDTIERTFLYSTCNLITQPKNKKVNGLESFLDSNRNYFQKSITSNFNDDSIKENLNFIQNRNKNIKVKEKRNNPNSSSCDHCSVINLGRSNNKHSIWRRWTNK